ncbi:MAG: alanine--tRNA ligase-related protein [Bacteroidales bacterium]|jgi:alanyl-tRNA synthetase|nr:alanine--tRNA ligase-related protein [Bacteroidales bacterium]
MFKEVKEEFNDYFNYRQYSIEKSRGLRANSDNLLFNISGGVIFENYINGCEKSLKPKIALVQRCLRTDGWKKIGFSGKHHLFFEMMGHFFFSVYDEEKTKLYFIKDAMEFLYNIGIPKKHLYCTIHPDDIISKNILETYDIDLIKNHNNTTISPKKNRSGYRVEIVFRKKQRNVELWNLVFTQYEDKFFKKPMKKIIADSGMSVERLVSAKEGKANNYECAEWNKYINILNSDNWINKNHLYRATDLLRSSCELFNENIAPGNKGVNYIQRKITRELFTLLIFNNIEIMPILNSLHSYKDAFKKEHQLFLKALQRGNKFIMRKIHTNNFLSNKDKQLLKESYGYPEMLIPINRF